MPEIRSRAANGWRPERAIAVFSTIEDGLLTEEDRDFIWRELGVPAHNHLVDEQGTVLARECDAHDGLHLEAPIPQGYYVEITTEPCACGQAGSRLLRVSQIEPAII
jgi:hypothetical protein